METPLPDAVQNGAAEEVTPKSSRKKKKKKPAFNQTEYRRTVNKQIADGIRYDGAAAAAALATEEDEAAPSNSSKRRSPRGTKLEKLDTVDAPAVRNGGCDAVSTSMQTSDVSPAPRLSLPSTPSPQGDAAVTPAPKRARFITSLPLLRSPTSFFGKAFGGGGGSGSAPSTPARRVFQDTSAKRPARPGWNGPGRGFAHAVVLVLLTHDKVKDKVRGRRAARVIQKNVRLKLLMPIRRQRAALTIQRNYRNYQEWLAAEKWRIVIKQERRNNKERNRKIKDLQKKKELRRANQKTSDRKKMERQAIAAGCWDPTVQEKQFKGWSSRDVAVLVALKYGRGLPNTEAAWEVFEGEFPKKKRSEINKFINKLKQSGLIDNLTLVEELSSEEKRRLIPGK